MIWALVFYTAIMFVIVYLLEEFPIGPRLALGFLWPIILVVFIGILIANEFDGWSEEDLP